MNIGNNITKTFRYDNRTDMFGDRAIHSRGLDDPTYISFKLYFGDLGDIKYNNLILTNMDMMPHPLFNKSEEDNLIYESEFTSNTEFGENKETKGEIVSTSNRTQYSTLDFLNDMNESVRAEMLREFIDLWNDIQDNYQYYFQKIEGIQDLLTISTNRGSRIKSDTRLTITCLEAIDYRITHLLNLYSKIAWDDTYQRWILPDIMRYFSLDIYISEFRTFHEPTQYILDNNTTNTNPLSYVLSTAEQNMPCIHIHCNQCEFDIESFEYGNINNIDVGDPGEQHTVRFKIKVGNITQKQFYPTFDKSAYLNDEDFNGRYRSKLIYDTNVITGVNSSYLPEYETILSASYAFKHGINIIMADQAGRNDMIHSYDPYLTNQTNHIMQDSGTLLTEAGKAKGALHRYNDTNTWIGNMLTTVESAGKSIIKGYVDSFKMKPINIFGAKLPFSVNELSSTLKGKDMRNLYDLARRFNSSVAEDMIGGTISPPSSHLIVEKIENMYAKQQTINEKTSRISQEDNKISSTTARDIYNATPDSESTNKNEVEYNMGYIFKDTSETIDTPFANKGKNVDIFEIPQVNNAVDTVKNHFINMMKMYNDVKNNATNLSQDSKETLKKSRESMDKSLGELAGIVSTATNLSPALLDQISSLVSDKIVNDIKASYSTATNNKIEYQKPVFEGVPSKKI